jgi:hypothetical protein
MSGYTEGQVILADALHSAALNGSPIGHHMSAWMRDWKVGDVVVETSTRSIAHWKNRIGRMLREYSRPLREDGNPEPYGHERHWVIETNHGEFDWFNAGFFRIPVTRHQERLLGGYAERCIVLPCRECEREKWQKREGSNLWQQVLR